MSRLDSINSNAMKTLPVLLALTAALILSVPATSLSRDYNCNNGRYYSHGQNYYRSNTRYCPPAVAYRNYRPYPYYASYPYGYAYPYGASYYSRPAIGISFSTGPAYTTYSRIVRTTNYGDGLAEDVQRALARRGFYRGQIDGDVGPGTRGAIREYQYRNRLEVTGRIDRSLLRSLGVS